MQVRWRTTNTDEEKRWGVFLPVSWRVLCGKNLGAMKQQLIFSAMLWTMSLSVAGQNVDWANPGNDKGGMRYSTLDQINKENVGTLKVAWTYHTKDSAEGTTIECTPVVIDGVAYVTTVKTRVAALNAASGEEMWSYDPYEDEKPEARSQKPEARSDLRRLAGFAGCALP